MLYKLRTRKILPSLLIKRVSFIILRIRPFGSAMVYFQNSGKLFIFKVNFETTFLVDFMKKHEEK